MDVCSADSATQTGVYYNIFTLPRQGEAGGLASGTEAYYAFDYGNIHFVVLDSFETSRAANGAMLTWLRNDLAATNQEWIIAFWHHPPYTKGSHDSDGETDLRDMRQNALPILEAAGVDLVLTGHSHSYECSFLIDGHYGASSTFNASMLIDGGDGRTDGDGEYQKPEGGPDGADPLNDLNSQAEEYKVELEAGTTFWWEAAYADPAASTSPPSQVLVTIRYRSEATWTGTLTAQYRDNSTLLATVNLLVNSQQDPVTGKGQKGTYPWNVSSVVTTSSALTNWKVRFTNQSTNGKKVWIIYSVIAFQ